MEMTNIRRAAIPSGALAVLILMCGCQTPQRAVEQRPVTGCFQFEWNAAAKTLGLPWGFELLAGPLEGWGNLPEAQTALTRLTELRIADHPFAFWDRVAADSVRVGHPGGGAFSLTLGESGQDLVGWGRSTGDALPLGGVRPGGPQGPVIARRVLCRSVSNNRTSVPSSDPSE